MRPSRRPLRRTSAWARTVSSLISVGWKRSTEPPRRRIAVQTVSGILRPSGGPCRACCRRAARIPSSRSRAVSSERSNGTRARDRIRIRAATRRPLPERGTRREPAVDRGRSRGNVSDVDWKGPVFEAINKEGEAEGCDPSPGTPRRGRERETPRRENSEGEIEQDDSAARHTDGAKDGTKGLHKNPIERSVRSQCHENSEGRDAREERGARSHPGPAREIRKVREPRPARKGDDEPDDGDEAHDRDDPARIPDFDRPDRRAVEDRGSERQKKGRGNGHVQHARCVAAPHRDTRGALRCGPPKMDKRENRESQRCQPGEEVSLSVPPLLGQGRVELVLRTGGQEIDRPARIRLDLPFSPHHPVSSRRPDVRKIERQDQDAGDRSRENDRPGAPKEYRAVVSQRGVREHQGDEKPGEERVVDVRERVPGEEQSEERGIARPSRLERSQKKEKQQREERAPLELDVRKLGEPPRDEGVDDAGDERRRRVAGDVAGESPGADSRKASCRAASKRSQ